MLLEDIGGTVEECDVVSEETESSIVVGSAVDTTVVVEVCTLIDVIGVAEEEENFGEVGSAAAVVLDGPISKVVRGEV